MVCMRCGCAEVFSKLFYTRATVQRVPNLCNMCICIHGSANMSCYSRYRLDCLLCAMPSINRRLTPTWKLWCVVVFWKWQDWCLAVGRGQVENNVLEAVELIYKKNVLGWSNLFDSDRHHYLRPQIVDEPAFLSGPLCDGRCIICIEPLTSLCLRRCDCGDWLKICQSCFTKCGNNVMVWSWWFCFVQPKSAFARTSWWKCLWFWRFALTLLQYWSVGRNSFGVHWILNEHLM